MQPVRLEQIIKELAVVRAENIRAPGNRARDEGLDVLKSSFDVALEHRRVADCRIQARDDFHGQLRLVLALLKADHAAREL